MENDYKEHGQLDIKRALDSLDSAHQQILTEIIENIPAGGSEDDIFAECIRRRRLRKLKAEEKKILTMFELADESDSNINLTDLMEKLKHIQDEIQTERMKG